MLSLVIFFALFVSSYSTPVVWTSIASGLYPSSFPAIFQRQGIYHMFFRGAASTLFYTNCTAPGCSGTLAFRDLGGNLGGSPASAWIKASEFHVFVPHAVTVNTTNTTVDWINSTNAGVTWLRWQPRPMAKPIKVGSSLSATGDLYQHIVSLSDGWDLSINRDYFYASTIPWNFLQISSSSQHFPEIDPLLLLGWTNDSGTVDVNNRKFVAYGIDQTGLLYQNGWDVPPGSGWLSSMTKVTNMNGLLGCSIFGTIDPGDSNTARMRLFISCNNGTVWQATRTWANRSVNLSKTDFQVLPISLAGTQMCLRPAGGSVAGQVTLFSVGSDGDLYQTSFSAP